MKIFTELACIFRGIEHWTAVDDENYDGPESAIGRGNCADDAIADLREQLDVTPAARRAGDGS